MAIQSRQTSFFLFGGTYVGLVHITENYPFTIIEPLCHFQYELNLIKYMRETNYQKSSKKIAIKQIYFFYFFESGILHFKIGITQDYAFLKQIMNSVNAYADLKV